MRNNRCRRRARLAVLRERLRFAPYRVLPLSEAFHAQQRAFSQALKALRDSWASRYTPRFDGRS